MAALICEASFVPSHNLVAFALLAALASEAATYSLVLARLRLLSLINFVSVAELSSITILSSGISLL